MFARSIDHTAFAFVALVLLPACVPTVQGSVNPAEFAALHRVVVLPFAIPDGAPETLSVGFADEVSSHLAGARFAIVDPASVVNAMTHQEIRGTDLADPRVAVRVGQLMGADAVLLGRVVTYRDQAVSPDLDTSLAVTIRIVDVRTREVVLSTSADATAAGSFCAQEMTCLRGKVMTAVGKFVALGGAS
jgi:hypothetical protein